MHNRLPVRAPCLFTEGIWQRGTPSHIIPPPPLTSAMGGRPDGQRWACCLFTHTCGRGNRITGGLTRLGPLHIQHEVLPPSRTRSRGPQRGRPPARAERCLSGLICIRQQTATGLGTDNRQQMEEPRKTARLDWAVPSSEQTYRFISQSFQQ